MKLDRGLCFIDLETTGTDIAKDRIVEFGVFKVLPDNSTRRFVQRFNPGMPIPPEATECHSITDADVEKCLPFSDSARLIYGGLRGCDLAGFNLVNYDIPLLWEEFARAGIDWDLTGVRVIDAGVIFKRKEERTLSAAVQFYCGHEHVNAHGALSDSEATCEVLMAQMKRYPDIGEDVEALAAASKYEGELERIDLAGKFIRNATGQIVFGFGKWKDKPAGEHLDYLDWMLRQEFSENTKRACRVLLMPPDRYEFGHGHGDPVDSQVSA